MGEHAHTCLYRLRDRRTCRACQAQEREEMRAYIKALEAEQEQARIERESLGCDALPAEIAARCEP